jgi:pimeloyl-ACP methyl ester carboxylesterase
MDRAYGQGDVYGEGNKEYVAGSHTFTDWFDDFTKIPQWQYVPPGLNPIVDVMNTWWGREVFGTGDLRQSERYKRAMDYLVAHPEVTFLDGHSLGGAVVLQLQKDFPERNLKTFTQGAPVLDLLGTQKAEIGAANVMRVSNKGDLVSFFDNSAKKTSHPNPFDYAPSFWHDFHNKEQAGGTLEGVPIPIQDNTVKTTWDTQPFNPLNINKNLTYDKTEGTKMTE